MFFIVPLPVHLWGERCLPMSTFRVPWSQTWAGGLISTTKKWALSIISFGHENPSYSPTKSKFYIDFPSPKFFWWQESRQSLTSQASDGFNMCTCPWSGIKAGRDPIDFNLGIRKSTPNFLVLCFFVLRKIPTFPGRPGILLWGILGWLEKCQLFRAWWIDERWSNSSRWRKINHHSDWSQHLQSNLFVPEFHFPKIGFLPNFTQTYNIEKDQSTLSLCRSCYTQLQSIYHP